MAKLVILKSLMDSYYDNMIEKSTTHKYIRRVPKSNGKGYNYFYPEDFKKPMKALLSFFGMKEDSVDKAYTNNNISQAYGVTKQGFAQHVLEYLTNRKTWNNFFANKANRDKYKVPEKPVKETETVKVSEKVIEGGKTKEKITEKVTETKEKNFKSTWNRSLMRKIYSMYNNIPEDKAENKPGIDKISVGDKVSYNGEVGEVTKDFENGLVFIKFDDGGMGRFFVKDLQKMNVTADEVTESADKNAAEQNVNGTNEAVQEEIKETDAGEHENRSQAMMGNDNAKKLGAIAEFENGLDFKLQPETKEKLVNQMSEYTIDALNNTMSEFIRNITPFTMNNLEDSIVTMNDRIRKEKHPLIQLYNQVKRDYLISLRDKQNGQNNTEEFDEAAYNDSHNWDAERLEKEKKLAESYGYDAFKNGILRATMNDELFNNYLNDIQDNKDTISTDDAIKGVKSVKHQLMAEWLAGWDRANLEAQSETEESKDKVFTDTEKKILALALMNEKDFDPTLNNFAYAEKIRAKFPQLAEKGYIGESLIDEVSQINLKAEDLEDVKDYINQLRKTENVETTAEVTETTTTETPSETKSAAVDYYVSGDGMWINKYLRDPEQFAKDGGTVSKEDKQIIAELDKETTSTPVTEKKLYRAVDASSIFGNISDGDFDDLVAHVVYGNNDKLIANKAGLLVNRAENKQITEKGFMSTTKDKEIADNWDGFTGSNKEVILELDIPDGMTGKDLAAYDVEGEEQKEVLLPRNLDYFIKKVTTNENGKILVQAQILGPHGNHIAMLGNQNARKYGLSEEDELEYNKQYNWYKDTYVDGTRRNNPYTNEEDTIEGILKDEADERFRVYGDKDIAYLALKDLYIDTTGKDYTPPAKDEPKPETEKQMKEEEKEYKKYVHHNLHQS